MRRFKRRTIILASLVVILLGGCLGAYLWLTRDMEAEENNLAVPVPSCDQPDVQCYLIDTEQSRLDFTIDAVVDIDGTFDLAGRWFAFVYLPEEDAWRVLLTLDIDGRTVDTGSGAVDWFITQGFQAERYPIGRFVGEGDALITDLDAPITLNMVGQLELSGVVREFSIPIQLQIEDDILTAEAEAQVNAAEFGVEFASAIGATMLDSTIYVTAIETDAPIDVILEDTSVLTPTPEE